jgi:hypothetical protein
MKASRILTFGQIIIFGILFLISAFASAEQSFRCGTKLVSVGDPKYLVLAKCGEPTYVERRLEKRIKRDLYRDLFPPQGYQGRREQEKYREPFLVEEYVEIEEWTYNRGSTSLITYLIFENGRLVYVDSDGYGY